MLDQAGLQLRLRLNLRPLRKLRLKVPRRMSSSRGRLQLLRRRPQSLGRPFRVLQRRSVQLI